MLAFCGTRPPDRASLDDLGEAELLVAHVELDVVRAHEDVAEDVERPGRRRHVETDHREEALAARLERVVLLGKDVIKATDADGDIRAGRIAVEQVLLVERGHLAHRRRAHLGGNARDVRGRGGEERRARVDDRLAGGGDRLAGDRDVVDGVGPVAVDPRRGLCHRHVRKVTRVVRRVYSSDEQLSNTAIVTKVEGEDILVELA
mmetsp:Transcript_52304/g.135570  ORF Transcript_52304/g.135570 Transcript_52304/m.135570 type:complete len:204 (-) Transcript_52304:597-1208(-)